MRRNLSKEVGCEGCWPASNVRTQLVRAAPKSLAMLIFYFEPRSPRSEPSPASAQGPPAGACPLESGWCPSAFGAAVLMVFRSFSSAARLSSLRTARYSSIVLGLAAMACASEEDGKCERGLSDGCRIQLLRHLSQNGSSRKSLTCGYFLFSEGDGTRTRNHRIDSPVL